MTINKLADSRSMLCGRAVFGVRLQGLLNRTWPAAFFGSAGAGAELGAWFTPRQRTSPRLSPQATGFSAALASRSGLQSLPSTAAVARGGRFADQGQNTVHFVVPGSRRAA